MKNRLKCFFSMIIERLVLIVALSLLANAGLIDFDEVNRLTAQILSF